MTARDACTSSTRARCSPSSAKASDPNATSSHRRTSRPSWACTPDSRTASISKIFRNEDFLYRTITVERPLKLNWQATPERIDAVFEAKAVQKLKETDAAALRAALDRLGAEAVWKNRTEFQKVLKDAAKAEGLTLPAPLLKTVTTELGEQDDTADTCTDPKGNPEPDISLRDSENVPWDEDINDYVAREVLPYAPDAWVDHSKTKEGAEIPFTRHFYQYVAPRSLEEIDRDLEAVMADLRAMLSAVEA